MSRTNTCNFVTARTHEGGPSQNINPLDKLKRLCMAYLLWEDSFYVDGKKIADQIEECCNQIKPENIVDVALEANKRQHLRHLPLLLIVKALNKGAKCASAISEMCNRPDQMTELLSLYWRDGRKPLAAQLKKGLAKAFQKFDEYQLGKWNRNNPIKLRDVLFLCHAKPKDDEQRQLWKRLINKELKIADTWETRLSSGADKKQSFQELLTENKMGALAILRNIRNFQESGIEKSLVAEKLLNIKRPLLPFQYIAAAKAVPQWEDIIEKGMVKSCESMEKLEGNTCLLIDVSGSMDVKLSQKGEMMRLDAACGLAIILREIIKDVDILSFSNQLVLVPPRNGFSLRDAILTSQAHSGTHLGNALSAINLGIGSHNKNYDRIIVITDEQTADNIPAMNIKNCYILNVGTYENGIKNNGQWHTITGFSENCIEYIREYESSINQ